MFWRSRRQRSSAQISMRKRVMIGLAAVVQFALLAAAQADLLRRPASGVRGSKWAWRAISLVNFVGPVAYFLFGRRSPNEAPAGASLEATAH
ncbi:MAG: PLDc_N domain-containing protein [Dehalococcoidia bacterium]|nr:PLDc_N domain-containing protein [Dehalococcoidia bacterium]